MKKTICIISVLLVLVLLIRCGVSAQKPQSTASSTQTSSVQTSIPTSKPASVPSLSKGDKSDLYTVLNAIEKMLFDPNSLAIGSMGISIVLDASVLIYEYDKDHPYVSTAAVAKATQEWLNDQDNVSKKADAERLAGVFLGYTYIYEASYAKYELDDSSLFKEMQSLSDVKKKKWHEYPNNAAQGIFYAANQVSAIDGFDEYSKEHWPDLKKIDLSEESPEQSTDSVPADMQQTDESMLKTHLTNIHDAGIAQYGLYNTGMVPYDLAAALLDWASEIQLSEEECRQITKSWIRENDIRQELLQFDSAINLLLRACRDLTERDEAYTKALVKAYQLKSTAYPWSTEAVNKVHAILEECSWSYYVQINGSNAVSLVRETFGNTASSLCREYVSISQEEGADAVYSRQVVAHGLAGLQESCEDEFSMWSAMPSEAKEAISGTIQYWLKAEKPYECEILAKILSTYWAMYTAQDVYYLWNDSSLFNFIRSEYEVYLSIEMTEWIWSENSNFYARILTDCLEDAGYEIDEPDEILKHAVSCRNQAGGDPRYLQLVYVVGDSDRIPLMQEPYEGAQIMGMMDSELEVLYLGAADNGYSLVYCGGEEGYTLTEYLLDELLIPERTVLVANQNAVLYPSDFIVEEMADGIPIDPGVNLMFRGFTDDGLFVVNWDGQFGYVDRSMVHRVNQPYNHQLYSVLRDTEIHSYNSLETYTIKAGSIVRYCEGYEDGKLLVYYGSDYGYVSLNDLEPIEVVIK